MSLVEYYARMTAFKFRQIDKQALIAGLAWSIRAVGQVDKDGNSIYPTFKDFFDYDDLLDKVYHSDSKDSEMDPELVRIARRLEQYRAQKGVRLDG